LELFPTRDYARISLPRQRNYKVTEFTLTALEHTNKTTENKTSNRDMCTGQDEHTGLTILLSPTTNTPTDRDLAHAKGLLDRQQPTKTKVSSKPNRGGYAFPSSPPNLVLTVLLTSFSQHHVYCSSTVPVLGSP
jgi:hypothetical protein